MKLALLASMAVVMAGALPACAQPTIRQYYQQPVPAPYPDQGPSAGTYAPPSPQPQQPLTPPPPLQAAPSPVGPLLLPPAGQQR